MMKIKGTIILLLLVTSLSYAQEYTGFEPGSTEYAWIDHIFSETNIEYLETPPYDLQGLPQQLEAMGLNGDWVVFGMRNISFSRFKEVFENSEEDNPADAEALTSWIESWHGASVHSRVYQIEDRGYIIAHVTPYLIIADLGNHEEAVQMREKLIAKNQ